MDGLLYDRYFMRIYNYNFLNLYDTKKFREGKYFHLLRSTLGERFVIFEDPVVDGIPVHARREDSRFLVTWTGEHRGKTQCA